MAAKVMSCRWHLYIRPSVADMTDHSDISRWSKSMSSPLSLSKVRHSWLATDFPGNFATGKVTLI